MYQMRTIIPGETTVKDLHQYLLGCVAPRPIAFVSTLDEAGRPNLAPYSFFNAFSSNPPIVVFSSNRRVQDNQTKDTLHNVRTTGECVINVVSHAIVRQMAVASVQFPPGESEFGKSGLTPLPATMVAPPYVAESPAHLECRVREIITLGEHGGAGHLIICNVLCIRVAEEVIESNNRINPHKMDLMGRMGRAYYVRASGDAIHTIVQSVTDLPIGFEGLPVTARTSQVLTGNDLGMLAGQDHLPTADEIAAVRQRPEVQTALLADDPLDALHRLAAGLLAEGDAMGALCVIWIADTV
ncbi:MAG: flavin reductase family protein [Saprospiraceae bacterium]|nr:flavin reductase family protein [Saprospiraceae bacterium]